MKLSDRSPTWTQFPLYNCNFKVNSNHSTPVIKSSVYKSLMQNKDIITAPIKKIAAPMKKCKAVFGTSVLKSVNLGASQSTSGIVFISVGRKCLRSYLRVFIEAHARSLYLLFPVYYTKYFLSGNGKKLFQAVTSIRSIRLSLCWRVLQKMKPIPVILSKNHAFLSNSFCLCPNTCARIWGNFASKQKLLNKVPLNSWNCMKLMGTCFKKSV